MNYVEHLLSIQNEIGESPIWHIQEQVLYWADIENAQVYRFDPATGQHQFYKVDLPLTALCLRACGGWVTATKVGLAFFDETFQQATFIVDPVADVPNVRFNDAVVDRSGRLWAGTLNEAVLDAPDGGLYRLDADETIQQLDSGFAVANGISSSPDGLTLYVSDMFHRRVLAYDHKPANGTISNRRVFVEVAEGEGLPDGLTVDSQGFVWIAYWGGWRVSRYDPHGNLEREIKLPVANVTRCTFGGQNLDELYINTAWFGLSEVERQAQPLAGDLFRLKTNIRGLPEEQYGVKSEKG